MPTNYGLPDPDVPPLDFRPDRHAHTHTHTQETPMKDIVRRTDSDGMPRIKLKELNRVQRRFVIEPWLTKVWVTSWTLCAALFTAAIWTDLHLRFALTGIVLFLVGGISAIAKGIHRESNVGLEGTVTAPQGKTRRSHGDDDYRY